MKWSNRPGDSESKSQAPVRSSGLGPRELYQNIRRSPIDIQTPSSRELYGREGAKTRSCHSQMEQYWVFRLPTFIHIWGAHFNNVQLCPANGKHPGIGARITSSP